MEREEANDAECVKRTIRGDHLAFREIVERHRDPVIRIVWRLSGDFHQAEDIAQDAFLRAHAHLKKFDPEKGSFTTWLYTIATNLARNAHRKIRPLPTAETEEIEDRTDDTPSKSMERREQFQVLNTALNELADPFRTAFILGEVEELPLVDIATIENVPVGTIKSRISRAKEKLRLTLAANRQPLS